MSFVCKKLNPDGSMCGASFENLGQLGGHARSHKASKKAVPASQLSERETNLSELVALASKMPAQKPVSVAASEKASFPSVPTPAQQPAPRDAESLADSLNLSPPVAPPPVQRMAAQDYADSILGEQVQNPQYRGRPAQQPQVVDPNDVAMRRAMAAARQVPSAPGGAQQQYEPGAIDRIADKVDWNATIKSGMDLITEIIKERRAAKTGPTTEHQIGTLALSAFAGNLGKAGGTTLGKGLLSGGADEYVTVPVMKGLLAEAAAGIATRAGIDSRKESAADTLIKQLNNASDALAAVAPVQEAAAPAVQAVKNVLEVHEQPQV